MHLPLRFLRRKALRLLIPVLALAMAMPAAHAQSPANKGAATQPATVRLKRFVIKDDPTFTGMEVSRGVMPAGWTVKGGVEWNLNAGYPAPFRIHWSDPNDVAAFDVYPFRSFCWNPNGNAVPPGKYYIGALVEQPPADQFEALAQVVIARDRPDLKDVRNVKKEKLPDLAKATYDQIPANPKYRFEVWAGKETFEYDLHGQAVEEEFTLVFQESQNVRFGNLGWSVSNVSSVRGPKGTLDELKKVRAVMAQGIRPNIEWYNKVDQFVQMRQRMTMQQLEDQHQRQQIFLNMQNQISDEQKKQFEKHMDDIDRRSDAQADTMREVSPWKTSDGDSYKLPNQYGHAWSGANGEIIMNNDPLYNPNSDPSLTPTNWTPMEQVKR